MTDAGNDDRRTAPERPDEAGLRLEELSLPQRVFVAAVQNPSRGVFVALLFAFAFSFYIAFWMAFPRIAAPLSAVAIAVALLVGAVLYLID